MRTIGLIAITVMLARGVAHAQRASTPVQPIIGDWVATRATCPTECALAPAELRAIRGRHAHFGSKLVELGANTCRRPRFTSGYWNAEARFGGTGNHAGLTLKDLGIVRDSAMVIEVRCPESPKTAADGRWPVWGTFVIVRNPNALIVVSDNAFSELARVK